MTVSTNSHWLQC